MNSDPKRDNTAQLPEFVYEANVSYCGGGQDFVPEGLFLTEQAAKDFLAEHTKSPNIRWKDWKPAKWRDMEALIVGTGNYEVTVTKRRLVAK